MVPYNDINIGWNCKKGEMRSYTSTVPMLPPEEELKFQEEARRSRLELIAMTSWWKIFKIRSLLKEIKEIDKHIEKLKEEIKNISNDKIGCINN